MSFDQIAKASKTTNREVEFTLPDGHKTGLFLTLRPSSSKEVQKVDRQYKHRLRDASFQRNKKTAINKVQDWYEDARLIAHVANWRWSEGSDPEVGRPEFSEQEVKEVLERADIGFLFREFIQDETDRYEDFLEV